MKVLWICNQCVPQIAEKLNIPGSNKEGWIAGLFDAVIQSSDRFALAIAFPKNTGYLLLLQIFHIRRIMKKE